MVNIEALAQSQLELFLDLRPPLKLRGFDDNVSLERSVMLVQFPKMQMMPPRHTRNRLQFRQKFRAFNVARRSFHQNVNRPANIGQAVPENEHSYHQRHHRVDPYNTKPQN